MCIFSFNNLFLLLSTPLRSFVRSLSRNTISLLKKNAIVSSNYLDTIKSPQIWFLLFSYFWSGRTGAILFWLGAGSCACHCGYLYRKALFVTGLLRVVSCLRLQNQGEGRQAARSLLESQYCFPCKFSLYGNEQLNFSLKVVGLVRPLILCNPIGTPFERAESGRVRFRLQVEYDTIARSSATAGSFTQHD